jgi:hypothetical protein
MSNVPHRIASSGGHSSTTCLEEEGDDVGPNEQADDDSRLEEQAVFGL